MRSEPKYVLHLITILGEPTWMLNIYICMFHLTGVIFIHTRVWFISPLTQNRVFWQSPIVLFLNKTRDRLKEICCFYQQRVHRDTLGWRNEHGRRWKTGVLPLILWFTLIVSPTSPEIGVMDYRAGRHPATSVLLLLPFTRLYFYTYCTASFFCMCLLIHVYRFWQDVSDTKLNSFISRFG